ncbi:MAG TPA: hypothetical protein VGF06_03630, partial [Terriglobales bacterium]
MRASIPRSTGAPAAAGASPSSQSLEFLLSMVEVRCASRNGNGLRMDSRAQQELQKIEQQIAKLQAVAGEDESTRREVQKLNQRIDALRNQVGARSVAWEKTELARHPQRPYTLDYIERIFTDWSEIHGDRGFADDPA